MDSLVHKLLKGGSCGIRVSLIVTMRELDMVFVVVPQVRYELEGGDTTPIPSFMIEQAQSLPDLIAVAEKRVTTMNGTNPTAGKDDVRTEYREVARPSKDYNDLPF